MHVHEPAEAVARLSSLGLSTSGLRRVMEAAAGGYAGTTDHHPKSASGFYLYAEATAALRRVTVGAASEAGWNYDELGGQARVFNMRTGVVIVVQSGYDATGVAQRVPTQRHPKGTATRGKVADNQLVLFELDSGKPVQSDPPALAWILLLAVHDGALHGELSLPQHMDGEGKVHVWRERILLEAVPLDGAQVEIDRGDENPGGGEVDVPVGWR